MTDLITIGFYCSGNQGRSPMLEAIGNKMVAKQGLDDKIRFISVGLNVGKEWWKDLTIDSAKKLIDIA